ncbi:MAG: hypothetical protein IIV41_11255, partial [Akkermansia sp.]|nr:hypothetical protein [Akkermansia sp.]
VSGTGATTVSFGKAWDIQLNTTQWLANGDWSKLGTQLTVNLPEYMKATLSAGTDGLSAEFFMKDGYSRWGDTGGYPGSGDKVVFIGGSGARIDTPLELVAGYFDSAVSYTVSGKSLTLDSMIKTNCGDLVLDAAVSAREMVLKESALISGTGSLSVEEMSLQDDIVTDVDMSVATLRSDNTTKWTIQGGKVQMSFQDAHSLLGVEVGEQAELALEMERGQTQTLQTSIGGAGKISLLGGGSLVKNSVGSLNLKDAELTGALIKGNGATTISGEVNVSGILDFGTETVVLAEGVDVTTNQLRMGTSARDQNTNLSIGEGASLSITGTTIADENQHDGDNSFLLAHWHNCASTLALEGGTLNAAGTVMHMGWDSGGTFQANSGEAYLKGVRFSSARGNADSFILGTGTTGTARVYIGSEGIKGFQSNDTVNLGNGTIVAADDFSIQGASSIKLYGTADTGTVFDANGHTITINAVLDAEGGGGSSAMTVRNGTVQQSGNMWIRRLNIAGDAAFVKDGVTVQGLSEASVITYQGSGEDKLDYSGNTHHEISDAAVQVNSASEKEVKTKLTNTSVENAGSGLLTLSNSGNTLSGLHATGGNIKVTGIETAAVAELEIAANKTITAANVVVSKLAELQAGATLAGNLELANSATIELGGTVTLDGVLTLQAGLTLDGAVLDAVQGLEVGESYTLFTGVNGLNVQSLQQA